MSRHISIKIYFTLEHGKRKCRYGIHVEVEQVKNLSSNVKKKSSTTLKSRFKFSFVVVLDLNLCLCVFRLPLIFGGTLSIWMWFFLQKRTLQSFFLFLSLGSCIMKGICLVVNFTSKWVSWKFNDMREWILFVDMFVLVFYLTKINFISWWCETFLFISEFSDDGKSKETWINRFLCRN